MSESRIQLFLSSLTESGLRSILFGLCRQGYLIKHPVSNEQLYSLTSLGRERCETLFPSLNRHAMDMSLLIFQKAPASDKGFHYLRKCCLQANAILLSRGVYLFPTGMPDSVKNEVEKLYQKATIVFKVGSIESGFDWHAINESLQLWDVASVFSGISKELTQLLTKKVDHKEWLDQEKKLLSNMIKRLIEALHEDSGLETLSTPDESQPLFILSRLQKLS